MLSVLIMHSPSPSPAQAGARPCPGAGVSPSSSSQRGTRVLGRGWADGPLTPFHPNFWATLSPCIHMPALPEQGRWGKSSASAKTRISSEASFLRFLRDGKVFVLPRPQSLLKGKTVLGKGRSSTLPTTIRKGECLFRNVSMVLMA